MRCNPVKTKLRQGEASAGVWSVLDHPGVAELLADAGFDWIVFDLEHGHFTTGTLRGALDAIRRTDVSPIVRVPVNDAAVLKQTLELGPEGVVVPMVNTAEEARYAVSSCRYPPLGARGIGAGRASFYGNRFDEYVAEANDNLLIVLQIEHEQAVRNIDDIVGVEGIDCLFIGPADLSASLGIPLQSDHPRLLEAVGTVSAAARRAGVPLGMWCRDERQAAQAMRQGVQFVSWISDAGLLSRAARASCRSVLSDSHAAGG